MSEEAGAWTRPRYGLAQQARRRAVELARDDGARLAESVRPALSALSAIADRARTQSRESAEVRALGLECLPHGGYLAYCVDGLRAELNISRSRGRWLASARGRAAEIEALFENAIALTTRTDIVGHLGLPLELVSAAQTGALAGLAELRRLHEHLDGIESGHHPTTAASTVGLQPSSTATWLLRTAARVLPSADRERYVEEFRGELHELACDGQGTRAQLVHALLLASRFWSLRRALPAGARGPAGDPDRVPVRSRSDGDAAPQVRRRRHDRTPQTLVRRRARLQARAIIRLQARWHRVRIRNLRRTPAYSIRGRHRIGGGIPVDAPELAGRASEIAIGVPRPTAWTKGGPGNDDGRRMKH